MSVRQGSTRPAAGLTESRRNQRDFPQSDDPRKKDRQQNRYYPPERTIGVPSVNRRFNCSDARPRDGSMLTSDFRDPIAVSDASQKRCAVKTLLRNVANRYGPSESVLASSSAAKAVDFVSRKKQHEFACTARGGLLHSRRRSDAGHGNQTVCGSRFRYCRVAGSSRPIPGEPPSIVRLARAVQP